MQENDLAVGLTARLKAEAQLREHHVADVATLFVNLADTARTADTEPAFTDGREDGVTVAALEERAALSGIAKQFFRVCVFVGSDRCAAGERSDGGDQKTAKCAIHR